MELDRGTLSVTGRSAWSDTQRLADFSFMLAGHCDAEDYDTWMNKYNQEQDIGPVFSM